MTGKAFELLQTELIGSSSRKTIQSLKAGSESLEGLIFSTDETSPSHGLFIKTDVRKLVVGQS